MTNFTALELERYAKHFSLHEIGIAGQQRLKESRVLCVGAGGLGSGALPYLAAAGVGKMGIVDADYVELSNLQRQTLYSTADLGRLKVHVAKERLLALNPLLEIHTHPEMLTIENVLPLFAEYDVIIDATDNFATRYLINDACFHLQKPDVFASVLRFHGQCTVFAAVKGPCYRCLYPSLSTSDNVENCADAGVVGALPGLLGSIQATETLKLLLNTGESLSGRLLHIDALRWRFTEHRLSCNPECLLCAKQTPFATLPRPNKIGQIAVPEISVTALRELQLAEKPYFLLDVRNLDEYQQDHLQAYHIPLHELSMRLNELDPQQLIIVYCRVGERGKKAVQILQAQGFHRVCNLQGGLLAWRRG